MTNRGIKFGIAAAFVPFAMVLGMTTVMAAGADSTSFEPPDVTYMLPNAEHANRADRAKQADTAGWATGAGTADRAHNLVGGIQASQIQGPIHASYADSAGQATKAHSADSASSAGYASRAGNVDYATRAGTASSADSTGYATRAGTATTAEGIATRYVRLCYDSSYGWEYGYQIYTTGQGWVTLTSASCSTGE